MNGIRQVQELNKRELEAVVAPSASWHADYRHTAFVYIGGLPLNLTEGDVITIFSQYGEPVYINLVRDKETGKSRGFCFLKYEDQRSCDLAVDNLGGAKVLDRILRVDHTEYKIKEGEVLEDNTGGENVEVEDDDDDDDAGDDQRQAESRKPRRPMLQEERELMKLERDHDDEDPMKDFLLQEKREEVGEAIRRWENEQDQDTRAKKKKSRPMNDHQRSRRDRHERERRERHRNRRDRTRSPSGDDRYERERGERPRHRRHRTRSPSSDDTRTHRRRRSP